MMGHVDEHLRALILVPMTATADGQRQVITTWVDTAFNGGFVLPRSVIEASGFIQESSAEAILADGRAVELETYSCTFDRFGSTYETQVVANEGAFPLLGTMLLAEHRLEIDYQSRTVLLQ